MWGLERGYCLMIGGDAAVVNRLDPIFATLAPGLGTIPRTDGRNATDDRAERGYIHAGPAGAGHFVKMVHNGIEYGLMQAYAEGFDVLAVETPTNCPRTNGSRSTCRTSPKSGDGARSFPRGCWICAPSGSRGDHMLEHFSGQVADSGEGHWTIDAAMEEAVPANVLTAALFARYRSRVENTFGDKLLSAMRFGFGGHVEMPQ